MGHVKTTAIIQARMRSTRLPGKVLKELAGRPMIEHVIKRVSDSVTLDSVVVATTEDSSDDRLAGLCERMNIPIFRGSTEDVLDRYFRAASMFNADVIVRVTGDCPLIDPAVVDEVVHHYRSNQFDYVSNTNPPTYPDGLDTEVFSFETLSKAWKEAGLSSEREHVTPFIRKRPDKFKLGNVENDEDLSRLRWTVDTYEDFSFVERVVGLVEREDFGMNDVLAVISRNPEIPAINAMYRRDEGYLRSLQADRVVKRSKE